jgi:hypothetical protein
LLSALTGSEVFSSQRSAAAVNGGRSSPRDAGASAKWRSASRSVPGSIPSGAGSLVTAGIRVARASVSASRVFGAADGHFISMYARQNASQDRSRLAVFVIESGRPVSVSNASPLRAAWRSSDRKLSACALLPIVRECGE